VTDRPTGPARTTAEEVAASIDAATVLFRQEPGTEPPQVFEPATRVAAQAAVQHLGGLYDGLPGTVRGALKSAGDHADSLSSDRLQGLSEIIQNADDVEATEVRFRLLPDALLVAHNGQPVRLRHVIGLATPWFTTKAGESRSTGRFGIGLMTLRSLTPTVEFHSDPYHFKIGDPTLQSIPAIKLPGDFADDSWTVIRIPLARGVLSLKELSDWFDRWDDSALLFLRHVKQVDLSGHNARTASQRTLRLRWDQNRTTTCTVNGHTHEVSVRRATSQNNQSWSVYLAEMPSPRRAKRSRKASDETTPVGIALSRRQDSAGCLYAGLPVVGLRDGVRVNAQFDPLTSRQGITSNNWNANLLEIVADLWSSALVDHFAHFPRAAWNSVPIDYAEEPVLGADSSSATGPIEDFAQLLRHRARSTVASALRFSNSEVDDLLLTQLAVEQHGLEAALAPHEVAGLADLPAALPLEARDGHGRWRQVLEDWRSTVDLPPLVTVEDAIPLLDDLDRSIESTIALAAVVISEGHGDYIVNSTFVTAADGTRHAPPPDGSAEMLTTEPHALAQKLGLGIVLHSDHLADTTNAVTVLEWLGNEGLLLNGLDSHGLLRRLASAGQHNRRLSHPLDLRQVVALRDALEQQPHQEREALGRSIGRAIQIQGFTFRDGAKHPCPVKPDSAYLPRTIDKEPDSFAVAAGTTPGLHWVDSKFERDLKSALGRSGLGALRFLRLLGVEGAPHVRPHPENIVRFASDRRKGLGARVSAGPSGRRKALAALGASFTLDDQWSPDLAAVASSIASETGSKKRRQRAAALIASLGRSWDRLGEIAEVDAAHDLYQWNINGRIPAFWIWQMREIAWLDDKQRTKATAAELRLDTPASVAVYGPNARYLHRDLSQSLREVVLTSFGVTGEPTVAELLDRLRDLRSEDDPATTNPAWIANECAVVYRAIAGRWAVERARPGGMTASRLRSVFEREQLVRTTDSWLPPSKLLAGPPLFGSHAEFVPAVPGTDSLWLSLGIHVPTAGDCVRVLAQIGRQAEHLDAETVGILLDALRHLMNQLGTETRDPKLLRRIAKLPLHTSQGWLAEKPVFAVLDPVLAGALATALPVWETGGEMEQFRPLFDLLGVTAIGPSDVTVASPTGAELSSVATDLLHEASEIFRDDLLRNDPRIAESLSVSWDDVGALQVCVHPTLEVMLEPSKVGGRRVVVPVPASLDLAAGTLYVREESALQRVEAGGRALSTLFTGGYRQVAQAWRAACDNAEAGVAQRLELASERAAAEAEKADAEMRERTAAFQRSNSKNHAEAAGSSDKGRSKTKVGSGNKKGDEPSPVLAPQKRRVLVDPSTLKLVDPEGALAEGNGAGKPRPGRGAGKKPVPPRRKSKPPKQRTAVRDYADLARENVGMELVRRVLASDEDRIVDLRTQRGVGADMMDELERLFELKVHAGAEPDTVTLTDAEVQRALTDPDFFLVIVSNVEGVGASPKVRVIVDPMNQLTPFDNWNVTLSGIHSSHAVEYHFQPTAAE
jgi:hypothetical protein